MTSRPSSPGCPSPRQPPPAEPTVRRPAHSRDYSSPVSHVRPEALLCDVDGVVRLWDDSMQRIDARFGLGSGTLADIAFRPDLLSPAVTGAISDAEWRAAVAVELAGHTGSRQRAERAVATWSAYVGRVDDAVVKILASARASVHVVLVSNATTRLHDDLTRLGVLDAVDSVISTADLGIAKPDPRVYLSVADRFGLTPDRCLFVDDTPVNVEAAQRAGMTGVVFQDAQQLRRILRKSGILN